VIGFWAWLLCAHTTTGAPPSWALLVVRELLLGPERFADLRGLEWAAHRALEEASAGRQSSCSPKERA
jgi:hypothetical protein